MVIGLGRCKYLELAEVLGCLAKQVMSEVQNLAYGENGVVVENRTGLLQESTTAPKDLG